MACERETGLSDLAAGGAESPGETAEARTAVAERRVVYPSSAELEGPCLVLRLRDGPDA